MDHNWNPPDKFYMTATARCHQRKARFVLVRGGFGTLVHVVDDAGPDTLVGRSAPGHRVFSEPRGAIPHRQVKINTDRPGCGRVGNNTVFQQPD